MLNKNNLLENKKVRDKILDMGLIYQGKITPTIKEEFVNLLRREGFISNKVRDVYISIFQRRYNETYREGFTLAIREIYKGNGSSYNNAFYITKEIIDRWLGYEIN